MPLTPGDSIGAYEITGLIGAGGMGEVYQARDTTLDRDVAIKILPESFAADEDRVARFTREAKVLATLSHPHIAGIYGIERTGETRALVMEFVPGEDLAQVLARGPLSVDDALGIGRQVAQALEAAHDAGVIHRDLKPANIKIRPDGTVKVLDFGLAKIADSAAAPGNAANSPTLTARATQMGMILGTAAYMAPEQARGRVVDRRADIWALGCVLYEMLAGRRAFEGDDISITLASVLKEDADWNALPPETPPALRRLLKRCLTKDPAARLRDAGDVGLEIDEIRAGPPPEAAPPVQVAPNASGLRTATTAALVLVVGALAAATAWWLKPEGPAIPLRKFSVSAPNGASISSAVMAPDGRSVALIVGSELKVRRLDALDTVDIPGATEVNSLFWSPDSTMVGFEARTQLWKVPATGGTPVPIGKVERGFSGAGTAVWLPGDRIVFTTGDSGLLEISALGGEPRSLLDPDLDVDVDFHQVSALPDGKGFLFVPHRANSLMNRLDLFDGQNRRSVLELAEDARIDYPVYSPSGHILYGRDNAIWAVPYDIAGSRVTGDPFRIAGNGVRPSVSSDGSLAIGTTNLGSDSLALAWVNARGELVDSVLPTGHYLNQSQVSPDGRELVGVRESSSGQTDLWIVDLERRTERRLSYEPGGHHYPIWSRDGRFIVYACPDGICSRPADGTGQPIVLVPAPAQMPSLSPDGQTLLFVTTVPKTGRDIYRIALGAGGVTAAPTAQPVPVIATDRTDLYPQVAPSGNWIAYDSNDAGARATYVAEFPSGQNVRLVSRATNPKWSRTGDRLYFLSAGSIDFVDVTTTPALVFSAPQTLFPSTGSVIFSFVPSARPDRFLINRSTTMNEALTVTIVQNWFAEFAGHAPPAR